MTAADMYGERMRIASSGPGFVYIALSNGFEYAQGINYLLACSEHDLIVGTSMDAP